MRHIQSVDQCSSTYDTPNFNGVSWRHTTKFRLTETEHKAMCGHKNADPYNCTYVSKMAQFFNVFE
jgi:hypothetical protein